jgi:all-trans-retinol 13,14-reductase
MIASYLAALPLALLPWWVVVPLGCLALLAAWVLRFPGRKLTAQDIKPIRASTFSPELVPDKIDTIVIGSGSGGCACANLLAQAGQRVLLLEQHYRTGGCTHSFRDKGCEWDTGLHYTSMAMSDRTQRPGALLNFMLKGKQQWTKLTDPYDEVVFPADNKVKNGLPNSNSYEFVTGAENTIDSILKQIDPLNQELRKRAQNYMQLCCEIDEGFTALGLTRILPKLMHFLVRKRVDRLMRLASFTVRDVQYAVFNLGLTVDDLIVSGCPKAPEGPEPDLVLRRMKAVLTHPIGDYAVQPRDATFAAHGITMAHYMEGAAYTVGPTQNISIRSSSLLRELGGEVLVDAAVQEIVVNNGRAVGVRVANTSALAENPAAAETGNVQVTEIRCKNVVCATSVYNLYNKLLPQDLPAVKDFQDPSKCSIRQSNGHIFLFCKIKGDANELGLPTHNLWYFNSYDMDEAFDTYFKNPSEVRPPTVYIGFPCTKDTTWKKRFPNVSNCILISDGLWEWFAKWENTPVHNRGADYEDFKSKLSKHLLDILYETVPQAKGKVEFHMLGTPLSEVTYLSSFHGGSYGTKCTPEMFAMINHKWTTTPHTPIPGLYMAGSDAFLPAVCGAMYGGCFGASAVLGHWGTFRMVLNFLADFAASLQEDNPKLSWPVAYAKAFTRFVTDTDA